MDDTVAWSRSSPFLVADTGLPGQSPVRKPPLVAAALPLSERGWSWTCVRGITCHCTRADPGAQPYGAARVHLSLGARSILSLSKGASRACRRMRKEASSTSSECLLAPRQHTRNAQFPGCPQTQIRPSARGALRLWDRPCPVTLGRFARGSSGSQLQDECPGNSGGCAPNHPLGGAVPVSPSTGRV
jgi:hypothetical protein